MNSSIESKNFEKALRSTFVGTFLGIFPANALPTNKKLKSLPSQLLLFISVTIFAFLIIDAVLLVADYFANFDQAKNFVDKLQYGTYNWFALSMTFAYGYQLVSCKVYHKLIHDFQATIEVIGDGALGKRPCHFTRFCWFITLLCLFTGILEDALFTLEYIRLEPERNPESVGANWISLYVKKVIGHWGGSRITNCADITNSIIDYIVIFLDQIASWGWVYLDAIICILCHALALQFRRLNEKIRESGLITRVNDVESNHDLSWNDIFAQFQLLDKLTSQTEKYLAPLILARYVYVGQIIVIAFTWIAPTIETVLSKTISFHIYFSSFYFLFRLALIIYFVAEVNHASMDILKTVECCPSSAYYPSVERVERKLIGNPVGIRLFGTFLITRHTFVIILGFVFTIELMLLEMALSTNLLK